MKNKWFLTVLLFASACSTTRIVIPMNKVSSSGVGEPIGKIVISQELYNVKITPNLHGLTPGEHDFYLQQNSSCELREVDNLTNIRDLPVLFADSAGNITGSVYAKDLLLVYFRSKSLVINDGGERVSCGVIRWE